MNLLVIDHWPMWIGLIWMAIVAGVDVITDKVPNRLTIPFGLLGLIVGLLSSLGLTAGITVTGGIGSALLGLLVAFLLSVVFYAARRIGGGPVKMQAAFGAWLGCSFGGQTLQATLVGTIGAVVMCLLVSRAFGMAFGIVPEQPLSNEHAHEFANASPAELRRLNRGLPGQILCLTGNLIAIMVAGQLGWLR